MKERPILFSAPMIRAILSGRKTQTRRVMRVQPPDPFCGGVSGVFDRGVHEFIFDLEPQIKHIANPQGGPKYRLACPYGCVGDRLWARETWAWIGDHHYHDHRSIVWRATDGERHTPLDGWRPSIHMPRWASRITLEITDIREERVTDISEYDAEKEIGAAPDDVFFTDYLHSGMTTREPLYSFQSLWDNINGRFPGHAWADRPWVWCVAFERVFGG